MWYCGIDPSLSSTGIVCVDEDGKAMETTIFSFALEPNHKHLQRMASHFRKLYVMDDIGAFGVEGYSFASKGNTMTKLVELGTIIRYTASMLKKPTYIIAPQSIKKFVAGKTFKKDEMRLEVYKRWGFEDKSNDIVDAFAIAQYARAIHNHLLKVDQKLTTFQKQAVESWAKKKNGIWVPQMTQ